MEPADLSATEARAMMARRQVSPVELAESCLRRIDLLNPTINAVVAQDREGVLAAARAAEKAIMAGERLGPLHGLPIAIKDMIDVTGLPTTYGSEIFRHNIAQKDDAMVAALRAAGAGIVGKTNNPEWSAGGNTRNAVYGLPPTRTT